MHSLITLHADKITIEHNALLYTATLVSTDTYTCNCAEHSGRIETFTQNNIFVHFDNLAKILQGKYGPHLEVPERLSAHLLITRTMKTMGLAVNTAANLIICLPCRRAVLPSQLPRHLRILHKTNPPQNIASIFAKFHIPDEFPAIHSEPIPYIEGLAVFDAFKCTHCLSFYTTPASLITHHRAVHQGLPTPKHHNHRKVQQYSKKGPDNVYFEITLPDCSEEADQASDFEDILDAIYNQIDSVQDGLLPDHDIRNVAPWLRITHWHEHVKPYLPSLLTSLVLLPEKGEFPLLKEAVSSLLDQACGYIDETSTLILERLNSPDIAKSGINNTPFHKHQNHKERMSQYMMPIIHLVAMLLRRTEAYPIPVPPHVEEKISAVRAALQETCVEDAINTIFDLLLSIWTQPWPLSATCKVADPTVHFLMLSALRKDGSFVDPKSFTNVIARLEYCMRAIFLKAIHASGDIDKNAVLYEQWFQEKFESTFNTLRTLQHLLSSIAYATISLPQVWWPSKDYSSMIFRGTTIKLAQITDILVEIECDMMRLWENEILCGLLLDIKYDNIVDDLGNTDCGYSFIHDRRNAVFTDHSRLALGILLSPSLYKEFVHYQSGSTVIWNASRMRQWLEAYSRFQLLHLVRAHITGGSPSRGTELTGMLLVNSKAGGVRNLVMFDRTLSLLCTYLKTSAIAGNDKLIPHAMDAFGADLLIQDLALARPFAELAQHATKTTAGETISLYRRHIFVNQDRLFNTADLTAKLEMYTLSHLGRKFGTNAWRHISTAFRRKRCGRMHDLFEEDKEDSIAALQSGHSRSTENRVYGLSGDGLAGAPEDLLPLFLEASTDWQKELRVVPGGINLHYRHAVSPEFSNLVKNGKITLAETPYVDDHIRSLLREFTSEIKDLIRDTHSSKFDYDEGTTVTYSPDPNMRVKARYSPDPIPDMRVKALACLRSTLKSPSATWTCDSQLDAILTALQLQDDLIAILPTGSGKSMIAIIPSLLETNTTTVLAVPLRSLLDDYIRRLTAMGVPFEVYNNSPILSRTNLLLVSADNLKTDTWQQHLAIASTKQSVARIVFDEAHIAMNDNDYRHALRDLYEIRVGFTGQLCLLSGTVPVRSERRLAQEFGVAENRVIIREPTNRPELQYLWRSAQKESDIISSAVEYAQSWNFVSPQDRGLIFVPFYGLGEKIATILGCDFYRSDEENVTLVDKRKFQIDWRSGKHRFMVCTQAFGSGNDYPHVRIVIHAGTPFNMTGYIQEVSRGGRDKRPAVGILVPGAPRMPKLDGALDTSGKQDMYDALVNNSTCIRNILTTFTDDRGISCRDDPQNELCNRCRSSPTSSPPIISIPVQTSPKRSFPYPFQAASDLAKRRKIDNYLPKMDFVSLSKRLMDSRAKCCFFCATRGVDSYHHDPYYCKTAQKEDCVTEIKEFKKNIRYTSQQKVCYTCHVPQGEYYELHARFEAGKRDCPYDNRIAVLAFGIFTNMTLRQEAEDHFSTKFPDMDSFLNWLVGDLHDGGFVTNLFSLYLWYAKAYP